MSRVRQALVCVVVVNYNSGQFLRACIDALKRQTFGDFEAIIVDNASTDQSIEWLGGLPPNFRVHKMDHNAGFAKANNAAAAMTSADWIAMLNADACPDQHWLEKLMKAAGRYPDVAMFGSTLVSAERADILDGTGDSLYFAGIPWRSNTGAPISQIPPEGETFSVCAAASLVQKEWFDKVGGFDERFFCYLEDTDLAYRMRLLGQRCVQTPDSVALHMGSALSGGRYGDFSQFYGSRNRIWLFMKNTPLLLLLFSFPFFLAGQGALMAKAIVFGYGGPVIKGYLAAMAGLWPILKARRQVQRSATVGSLGIARALTWSPLKLLRRGADIRPM
ncbi:MAG: glycosyltransferase family 2 protein [Nitrospinota bacterium]|nr:glycosyltransferase family 2 protein [Nitrospinota bacterium]